MTAPAQVAHHRAQHLRHPGRALDGHGGRAVPTGDLHPARQVRQVGQRGEPDTGLTQRGQHCPDVVDEDRRRADDEHATAGVPLAPGVHQIGNPVQRHSGLAGARPARDDQRAVIGRAHGLVLLTLDRRDDVAHVAGALAPERREEGAVTDDDAALERVGRGGVEQLVVDAQHPVPPGRDGAAAHHALRIGRGRPVEGRSRRRSPVHDDRLLPLAAQPHPAQVVHGPVVAVQPTEDQPLAGQVEVGSPVGGGLRTDIPLVHRLRRSTGRTHALALALQRLHAQDVQTCQRPIEHLLLPLQLARERPRVGARSGRGVCGHRDSLPNLPAGATPTLRRGLRDSSATSRLSGRSSGDHPFMTSTAYDATAPTRASVRPVRRASGRLRVVGGSGRLRWWHGRLVLGCTLAGAMVGALFGVVQAVLTQGPAPIQALESYGAGAGLGTSIGLVFGLVLALLIGLADRYVLPQSVRSRPVWVRYRR